MAVSVCHMGQRVIVFFLVIPCWSCELPQSRPLTFKIKNFKKVFWYLSSSWSKYWADSGVFFSPRQNRPFLPGVLQCLFWTGEFTHHSLILHFPMAFLYYCLCQPKARREAGVTLTTQWQPQIYRVLGFFLKQTRKASGSLWSWWTYDLWQGLVFLCKLMC